ncbi:adenylyl-sulfate kinase [Erythrobacteraceae bacterium CFH 75059]|uniref:adenylyl-sulfate kinase n=1 Tax=Qipengyuania thermophila TaxID=2509361 RepID=UPI0010201057|nr:adenylyl-sulfate kinase [Qipengyuania thermophila]TCD04896.1 adenylyl-sulfate kinase [Erythrobacteraceae bacterium CFH 75059]
MRKDADFHAPTPAGESAAAPVRTPDGGDRPVLSLLRFITCGSVDDGKSTLIGRLLHDTGQIREDQVDALRRDSRRFGTQGERLDLALLTDGLAAEREQGITIDVAYRFFSTARRRFIVADCPGHEQYTRNMVTGASTAAAAVLLVDARHGVATQTRRHAYLCHLLGIRQVILAVNKMDLVAFDRAAHEAVDAQFRAFADALGIAHITSVPISALAGDNVLTPSPRLGWHDGPTLVGALEAAEPDDARGLAGPFRMPVQAVHRAPAGERSFAGLVASGTARRGERVTVLPSGASTTVAQILSGFASVDETAAGQSVALVLADPVDCSRGSVICAAGTAPEHAAAFEATLVWMDEEPLLPGRAYTMKLATQTVSVRVQEPRHEVNINTLEHLAARTLRRNSIGVAEILCDQPVLFEPYATSRALGGFILVHPANGRTVGAGMITAPLRRTQNVQWQPLAVTRQTRASLKRQRPRVLWFTGLSGAGKSTIANAVEERLVAAGHHTFLLDGDNIRQGLNRDLGFGDADRVENIRRIGEVARLMTDAGLIVLAAFISPFRAERDMVRSLLPPGEFVEIFVDTPLAVAEARDVKGLYRKARAGEIANFTGISSPYEPPLAPELTVDTTSLSPEEAADLVIERLKPF